MTRMTTGNMILFSLAALVVMLFVGEARIQSKFDDYLDVRPSDVMIEAKAMRESIERIERKLGELERRPVPVIVQPPSED